MNAYLLAPGFEKTTALSGGFVGERLRGLKERVVGFVGHLASRRSVKVAPEVTRIAAEQAQAVPTEQQLAQWYSSTQYLQNVYGLPNDYRVDPWARHYENAANPRPRPYMVQGERGGVRYETANEKTARMADFYRSHPDANAFEAHQFEYSGQLPQRIREAAEDVANRDTYNNANPWNPNAANPYNYQDMQQRLNLGSQEQVAASAHNIPPQV